MKKMVLGLLLALAASGFLLSPRMAAADPPQAAAVRSVADEAFLTSLAAPAPVSAAKRPGMEKALCSAQASCGSYTISCQGNNSTTSCSATDRNCPNQRGHVTCDGVTTWCSEPCPGCPSNWCTFESDCAWSCFPCDYIYSCSQTNCTDSCRCRFSTCPV